MAASTNRYWLAELEEEATRRSDQPSFHLFAEGMHSDARGQVYNLKAGASLTLPAEKWPGHVFIALGVHGEVTAELDGDTVLVRRLSQLVVLPGVPCTVSAVTDASVELISFVSTPPSAVQRSSRDR